MNILIISIALVFVATGIYIGTVLTRDDVDSTSESVRENNGEGRVTENTSLPTNTLSDEDESVTTDLRGRVINMSNSGLTTVPGNVFNDTGAVELNLSGNILTGALPAEVRQMSNLRVLNLENNNFTGIPAEVGQLSKLEVLDVSGNPITGLPNELGNLSNLKVLDLTGTEYSKQDLVGIRERLPSTVVIKTDS